MRCSFYGVYKHCGNTMTELLPCPFCGETELLSESRMYNAIVCNSCYGLGPAKEKNNVKAWNTRDPFSTNPPYIVNKDGTLSTRAASPSEWQVAVDTMPFRPDFMREIYKRPSGEFRDERGLNCNNLFAEDGKGDWVATVKTTSIGAAIYYGELLVWADKLIENYWKSKAPPNNHNREGVTS